MQSIVLQRSAARAVRQVTREKYRCTMSPHITHYLLVTITLTDQGRKWCFLGGGSVNECFALLIVCSVTSVIKQYGEGKVTLATGHTVPDSGRTIQSPDNRARVTMFMEDDVCNVSQEWDGCKLCHENVCRMCEASCLGMHDHK